MTWLSVLKSSGWARPYTQRQVREGPQKLVHWIGFPGGLDLRTGVSGPSALLLSPPGSKGRMHKGPRNEPGIPQELGVVEPNHGFGFNRDPKASLARWAASSRAQPNATPDGNSKARAALVLPGITPPALGSPTPPSKAGIRSRSHAQAPRPSWRPGPVFRGPAWPNTDPSCPAQLPNYQPVPQYSPSKGLEPTPVDSIGMTLTPATLPGWLPRGEGGGGG